MTEEVPSTDSRIDSGAFVIVRAYNEVQVIREVLWPVCQTFANVVVVDDGSTDGTIDRLAGLKLHVVSHCVHLGAGAALQTGINYALSRGAQWILTFDADGQHRLEDALELLRVLKSGDFDVVLGSRFAAGGQAVHIPLNRKLLLRAATWFSNLTTRTELTDTHNGLRGLSRQAASVIDISQNGMAYASQILAQIKKARLRICEIPVTIEYTEYSRRKGQSSFNAIRILIDLVVGRLMR
jgi:glycosyltransferase involved in cell wall biosynthesis